MTIPMTRPGPKPQFTAAEDERLLALWNDHNSVAEIANSGEFRGRSRNSIIGRIHRLRKKLGAAAVPIGKLGHPPMPVKKKRVRRQTSFAVRSPSFTPVDPTPEQIVAVPPAARQLTLLELGPKDCRFIVSGAYTRRHLYCAADASAFADDCGNNCYCAYHQRIMRASGAAR